MFTLETDVMFTLVMDAKWMIINMIVYDIGSSDANRIQRNVCSCNRFNVNFDDHDRIWYWSEAQYIQRNG